tara:strand:- start:1128 stop:1619 length:492 start_codon:yes stop_codon:yes gene_type:complete
MRRFIKWTIILIVLIGSIYAIGEYLKFEDEVKQAKAAENFFRIMQAGNLTLEEKLSRTVDPMGAWDPGSENYINASKLYQAGVTEVIFPWTPNSQIAEIMMQPLHTYYLPWNGVPFERRSLVGYTTFFELTNYDNCRISGQLILINSEIRSLNFISEIDDCLS